MSNDREAKLLDMICTLEEALVATEGWIQQSWHPVAVQRLALAVCDKRGDALDKLADLRVELGLE